MVDARAKALPTTVLLKHSISTQTPIGVESVLGLS